jgi:hypothetical protein
LDRRVTGKGGVVDGFNKGFIKRAVAGNARRTASGRGKARGEGTRRGGQEEEHQWMSGNLVLPG